MCTHAIRCAQKRKLHNQQSVFQRRAKTKKKQKQTIKSQQKSNLVGRAHGLRHSRRIHRPAHPVRNAAQDAPVADRRLVNFTGRNGEGLARSVGGVDGALDVSGAQLAASVAKITRQRLIEDGSGGGGGCSSRGSAAGMAAGATAAGGCAVGAGNVDKRVGSGGCSRSRGHHLKGRLCTRGHSVQGPTQRHAAAERGQALQRVTRRDSLIAGGELAEPRTTSILFEIYRYRVKSGRRSRIDRWI